MKGIVGRKKKYVDVIALASAKGEVTPLAVVWEDGRRFNVNEVLDARRAPSRKTGDTGMRYTIRVGEHITYLWHDEQQGLWFVEAKVIPMLE
ncbi:MAG: hypothetical protein Q4A07_10010 [Coriobacteriales bacterium]|nr:hypothetical protein [Coriobacteriales bacterium]